MDPEEERVLYLTRVGRDKIFKYGTYTMTQERAITQDHPFYAKREDAPENAAGADQMPEAGYGGPEYEAAASAPQGMACRRVRQQQVRRHRRRFPKSRHPMRMPLRLPPR